MMDRPSKRWRRSIGREVRRGRLVAQKVYPITSYYLNNTTHYVFYLLKQNAVIVAHGD